MKCEVCKRLLIEEGGQLERCARIERGDFNVDDEDRFRDNVKFSIYICGKCFLEDQDMCAFMNKIGHRIR